MKWQRPVNSVRRCICLETRLYYEHHRWIGNCQELWSSIVIAWMSYWFTVGLMHLGECKENYVQQIGQQAPSVRHDVQAREEMVDEQVKQ